MGWQRKILRWIYPPPPRKALRYSMYRGETKILPDSRVNSSTPLVINYERSPICFWFFLCPPHHPRNIGRRFSCDIKFCFARIFESPFMADIRDLFLLIVQLIPWVHAFLCPLNLTPYYLNIIPIDKGNVRYEHFCLWNVDQIWHDSGYLTFPWSLGIILT